MKFYRDPEELLNTEVPFLLRKHLYPIIECGMQAYVKLVNIDNNYFSRTFLYNIRGSLINYLIFRQFQPDMTKANFPFKFAPQEVNIFKYTALNLLKDNVIINVGKAYSESTLPNKSMYRRNLCRLNNFHEKTLFYDTDADNNFYIKNDPYCMFLTYGYKYDEISFVNLLVPNHEMTGYVAKVNLKNELSLYEPENPAEIEEKIAELHDDVALQLKLLKDEAK